MSEHRYFCAHCVDVSQMTQEQASYHATMAHGYPYRQPLPQTKHFPVVVTLALLTMSAAFVIGLGAALVRAL